MPVGWVTLGSRCAGLGGYLSAWYQQQRWKPPLATTHQPHEVTSPQEGIWKKKKKKSNDWKSQQLIITISVYSFQMWMMEGPGLINLVRDCERLGSLQHVREKGKCVRLGNRLFSGLQALYFV